MKILTVQFFLSTQRKYNGKNLPVRVYTTRGLKEQGRFALENCHQVVDYFSEIFKIDYPLPKIDLLAVHEFSVTSLFLYFSHQPLKLWSPCGECFVSLVLRRLNISSFSSNWLYRSTAWCNGKLGSHHVSDNCSSLRWEDIRCKV